MTSVTGDVDRVAIRVDGHHRFGLGHLYRCLNVAMGLRERHALDPVFVVGEKTLETGFQDVLRVRGLSIETLRGPAGGDGAHAEVLSVLRRLGVVLVVTDLLSPEVSDTDLLGSDEVAFEPVAPLVGALRAAGHTVVSITDEIERIDIRPDVVVDHSCHYPAEDYSDVPGTEFHLGPAYYPIGSDFDRVVGRGVETPDRVRRILVMFGGSDHNEFTRRTVEALRVEADATLEVVVGPAVRGRTDLVRELRASGAEVLDAPASVAEAMARADLAVTAGGNSLFEFAAVGTPSVALSTRDRQERNARYFESRGTTVNLGLGDAVGGEAIRDAVLELAADAPRRARMSEAGHRVVDGRGLARVAGIVAGRLAEAGEALR